ncbi:MAG TPA: hypothetical protein VK694_01620 [Verrucomicrobiae bacterium]|nr:hypothetical protein [Verrucomicrobiae bacterium]
MTTITLDTEDAVRQALRKNNGKVFYLDGTAIVTVSLISYGRVAGISLVFYYGPLESDSVTTNLEQLAQLRFFPSYWSAARAAIRPNVLTTLKRLWPFSADNSDESTASTTVAA